MLRSIIDFGAVPDGRTNCAAAIQAAVDAAAGTPRTSGSPAAG